MEKRCFACMNRIESDICTRCGNNNADEANEDKTHLKAGTILHDQYFLGIAIEQNGEGITYVAYDTVDKKRVRIREFYPDTLCDRAENGCVIIKDGFILQYKSLLMDFTELSRQLMEFKSNNCLVKSKSIFLENNTTYVVYEDVAGTTLTRFLREKAGELSWEETENLFLPLLYTVKLLNSEGIIHRGISPETIIVTPQNELKLTGICTSSARANNSEIKSELYVGYAAPEQYQKCTSYGEWTDVYALCAVLYKMLTGTMPPRADSRSAYEEIITPKQLNSVVPENVSNAITKGLSYNQESRIRNVKELIGELYSSQNVIVEKTSSDSSYYDKPKKTTKKKIKLPIWLIVVLITLPVLLTIFLIAYKIVLKPTGSSSKNETSSIVENTSSQDDKQVDAVTSNSKTSSETSSMSMHLAVFNFKDLIYDDIVASETFNTTFKFKKIEKYDDHIPFGTVMEQSPEANKVVSQGSEIQLVVSKGPRYFKPYPLKDETTGEVFLVDTYKKTLTDVGFKVKVEQIDSPETPHGQIVKLSVPFDRTIDKEEISEITIYVAK